MRTIKFRAWNPTTKTMLDLQVMTPLATEAPGLFLPSDPNPSDPKLLLMQFTGLKDKNGKDIYEGDILGSIWGGYIGWCQKCKAFQLFGPFHDCMACEGDVHWYELVDDDGLDVIGNIYENPEIL